MRESVKHLDVKIDYILQNSIWHPIDEEPRRKRGQMFIMSECSIYPYICNCTEYREFIKSVNKDREDSLLGWCYAEHIMSLAERAALTELAAYKNYYGGLKSPVLSGKED